MGTITREKVMTLDEWERQQEERKAIFLAALEKKAEESARLGSWEEFIDFASVWPEYYEEVFDRNFFSELPGSAQVRLATSAHINHGDSMPCVYLALVHCALEGNYLTDSVPGDLMEKEYFYVYRAGEEHIEESRERISWTLSYDVARFFAYEYCNRHARAIYRAKISPRHVLCYTNGRNEEEVMQYCAVYDVEEIEQVNLQ